MQPEAVPDAGPTIAAGPAQFAPATERRVERSIPRRLRHCFSLDDMEGAARSFLPKPIFGYVSGTADRGVTARANLSQFDDIRLLPRHLQGFGKRDPGVELFGTRYEKPFAIAPMGFSALAAFDGDVVLAEAARLDGTFAMMSATSLTSLERVAEETGSRWFQAYLPGDPDRIVAMLERVQRAGYDNLVVTIDIPLNGNREIDRRNGFVTPLKPSLPLAWSGMTRPAWSIEVALRTLRTHGMPHFENLDVDRGPPIVARDIVRSFSGRELLSWDHLQLAREQWKGNLLIKGIMSAEDTERSRKLGADGIVVSNHGGRQLDGAPPPMEVLHGIVAERGRMKILVDSGFRRGTDVLKAIAAGADMILVGRPFLYAASVGGVEGVRYAMNLLSAEIDRGMAFTGTRKLGTLQNGTQEGIEHVVQ